MCFKLKQIFQETLMRQPVSDRTSRSDHAGARGQMRKTLTGAKERLDIGPALRIGRRFPRKLIWSPIFFSWNRVNRSTAALGRMRRSPQRKAVTGRNV